MDGLAEAVRYLADQVRNGNKTKKDIAIGDATLRLYADARTAALATASDGWTLDEARAMAIKLYARTP